MVKIEVREKTVLVEFTKDEFLKFTTSLFELMLKGEPE